MAVPDQSLDGIRLVVGNLNMDGCLIAAGGVELVRFAGRAVLVAGTNRNIRRCLTGLLGCGVRRKGLSAVRMLGCLEDDLLVHLLEVVATHAKIIHVLSFYSTPKNLRMPLAVSTNACASSTEL